MQSPLVTVICLCYNHGRFVGAAIESALNQTYPHVQLIVVDDASSDNSVEVIEAIVKKNPAIEFLSLKNNIGNCRAFNAGLAKSKGEYVIDLAADDVLLPHRIEMGVKVLREAGKNFGVHFSDAELISATGETIGLHSDQFPHHSIPQGDIYKELIGRYFICPPSMMFTREGMDALGGYDETLLYEDFDFWIRSSRKFKYVYTAQALIKKRITGKALSDQQFKVFSRHSETTFRVCEKIMKLNATEAERQALSGRIRYEIKLNLRLLNFKMVSRYLKLLLKNSRLRYS
ncbi:MAG: glycosyltransferase family A protein [Cyclobacteriaceae bacterium]